MTSSEAQILCRKILRQIRETPDLRNKPFGRSVWTKVQSILWKLEAGGILTTSMENALENWFEAVNKTVKKHQKQNRKLKLIKTQTQTQTQTQTKPRST